jgi:hypothetical protein
MGHGDDRASKLELWLVEALATTLTRRMAERVVADVRRNRLGAPWPLDVDGLLALVRDDITPLVFLRVGGRARGVLAELEERVLGLSALADEAWQGPRLRLVYVGRSVAAADHFGRAIGAVETRRVDELFELLIALETDERALLLVDAADCTLDPGLLARFVPDFPTHVLTFVAASSPATREAFLSSGAAFRATLRSEPIDHPDVPRALMDLVRGSATRSRRPRGGSSSTTQPARAA